MATKKKPAAAKRETIFKDIEIEITDEDNTLRMKQHLECEFRIDTVKAERAAEMSEYTQQLKELRKLRSELITTIQTKMETRSIECVEDADFRTNTMFTRRADTGEVVGERALTVEERQEALPFAERTVDERERDELPFADGAEGDAPVAMAKGGATKVVRIRASAAKRANADKKAARVATKKKPKARRRSTESSGAGE
jgi:hypothetical protein